MAKRIAKTAENIETVEDLGGVSDFVENVKEVETEEVTENDSVLDSEELTDSEDDSEENQNAQGILPGLTDVIKVQIIETIKSLKEYETARMDFQKKEKAERGILKDLLEKYGLDEFEETESGKNYKAFFETEKKAKAKITDGEAEKPKEKKKRGSKKNPNVW